jgi:hypothetical protein
MRKYRRPNTRTERFKSQDGRVYIRDERGVIHRVDPIKPWSNKAEHKRHKKQRRELREEV